MENATARRRVIASTPCTGWNGASAITAHLAEHSGLAQHHLIVACSAKPAAGVLRVSVRPPGAAFFVPVASIDLTVNGSASILFPALFDAMKMDFSTALSGGTVSTHLSSVGNTFTSSEVAGYDAVSRRRMITSRLPAWTPTAAMTLDAMSHSGLSQHQITLSGGAGTVQVRGRQPGSAVFVAIGMGTDAMDAAGSQAVFSGIYDALQLVPVGTVTGSVVGQLDSIGTSLFYGDTIFRSTGTQPGQIVVNGNYGPVWLGDLVLGSRPPSDFGWYGAFPSSTYLTLDKQNEQEDVSLVFTVNGAARWEVGATTELPGHPNDYHFKRVTGAAGAEVFTDVLMLDWATGNTWLPSPFMLGIGGLPSYPLHVIGNAPAGRVAATIQNANTGAGSVSTELVFATGPGSTWSIGNDYGENGGDNLFIASSTGGLRVLIDNTTFAITGNVTASAATLSGLATLNAGLLIGTGGTFQQGAIYYDASIGVVHGAKSGTSYDWTLTDTSGLLALTMAHGTKKLTTWDTLSVTNGIIIGGVGSFQQGAIYKDLSFGLVMAPIAGTTYDWLLTDTAGNTAVSMAHGTKQLTFADALTASNGINVTNGTSYGSTVASGFTDLSKHIRMYGTSYGMCIVSNAMSYVVPAAAQHTFMIGAAFALTINATGFRPNLSMLPGSDNTFTCGGPSNRWSVVYAGTGTINTSDAREKTAVVPLTANELAAAKDLAAAIGTYQWLSAIQLKGQGDARHHVGLTVQQAIAIMQAHGLDPMAYGFICYDQWPYTPALLGDDGVTVLAPEQLAGDRYSFRTDELCLFIARGFDARLTALEAP
jgi:hypothetical protein